MRALTASVNDLFTAHADSRPLTWLRIIIGVDCAVRAFDGWRIIGRVLNPQTLRAPYEFGILPVSPAVLPWYVGTWFIAAVAFAVGWHTRIAGSLLALLMFGALLIDQQTYSNHLYLLSLVVLLLTVADSGCAASLDARRRGEAAARVPAWPITLLKLQVSLVYAFSALAKLNLVYISGAVIYGNLRPVFRNAIGVAPPVPMLMFALALGSVIIELWLAVALWDRHWRRTAAAVGMVFHLSLVLTLTGEVGLQLAVFTVAMIALYIPFFDHSPRRLTVYFDDNCGICASTMRWFLARDHQHFISPIGAGNPSALRHDMSDVDLAASIVVVDELTRNRLTRTRAFAAMVMALPMAYQFTRIAALPGFVVISDLVYRLVARFRHRISKRLGLENCRLTPPRISSPQSTR